MTFSNIVSINTSFFSHINNPYVYLRFCSSFDLNKFARVQHENMGHTMSYSECSVVSWYTHNTASHCSYAIYVSPGLLVSSILSEITNGIYFFISSTILNWCSTLCKAECQVSRINRVKGLRGQFFRNHRSDNSENTEWAPASWWFGANILWLMI